MDEATLLDLGRSIVSHFTAGVLLLGLNLSYVIPLKRLLIVRILAKYTFATYRSLNVASPLKFGFGETNVIASRPSHFLVLYQHPTTTATTRTTTMLQQPSFQPQRCLFRPKYLTSSRKPMCWFPEADGSYSPSAIFGCTSPARAFPAFQKESNRSLPPAESQLYSSTVTRIR